MNETLCMEQVDNDNVFGDIILENEYLVCKELKGLNTAYCSAKLEYIPIDFFKESFLKMADAVKGRNWTNFIFDKSALTTFHQPSMEWYYTEWKMMLVKEGLSRHFKILPPLKWFERSVEAGKDEIIKNNPSFDFSLFSVNYVDNLDEAIAEIKSM
jgi:hypothetical protein